MDASILAGNKWKPRQYHGIRKRLGHVSHGKEFLLKDNPGSWIREADLSMWDTCVSIFSRTELISLEQSITGLNELVSYFLAPKYFGAFSARPTRPPHLDSPRPCRPMLWRGEPCTLYVGRFQCTTQMRDLNTAIFGPLYAEVRYLIRIPYHTPGHLRQPRTVLVCNARRSLSAFLLSHFLGRACHRTTVVLTDFPPVYHT